MSHLGANSGENLRAPEVDIFLAEFIAVLNHSRGFQKEWVGITGQKKGGYGGVRWFNRCDVLANVLPTLGREGTMQVALVALNASSSAISKRLLIQSNYLNPSRTEQLHLEVAVSVAVGQIMYEMTYFAEADQLNTVFGI